LTKVKQALKSDPSNIDAIAFLGIISFELENWNESIKSIGKNKYQ